MQPRYGSILFSLSLSIVWAVAKTRGVAGYFSPKTFLVRFRDAWSTNFATDGIALVTFVSLPILGGLHHRYGFPTPPPSETPRSAA